MEEVKIGRLKFTISKIPDMKGCNITLPEGVTIAYLSLDTLKMLVRKIEKE